VKIGSSLIFYFVAIDDPRKMQAETYTRRGTGCPASNEISVIVVYLCYFYQNLSKDAAGLLI
jgi:hypothetical protein